MPRFSLLAPGRARPLLLLLACGLAAPTGCQFARPQAPEWIQTELFFGLSKPDGTLITDAQWQQFVDDTLTPAFPDGLTILHADGQYADAAGTHREPSRVVLILYPRDHAIEADFKIDTVIHHYLRQFKQETVLRADSSQRAYLARMPAMRPLTTAGDPACATCP